MVRTLCFLLVLLLCSSVARAVDPTTVLTGTITPTGGGIACDFGPTFTGSIPAPAAAAGFTHCAYNSDFAQLGAPSTWLGNCGATSPLWWNVGYTGNDPLPCSDYSVAFDSLAGTNVLHMTYTPADAVAQHMMTWMSTVNGGHTLGYSFPQGVYIQTSWRSNAATQHALDAYLPKLYVILTLFSWGYQFGGGNPTDFIEWDYYEAGVQSDFIQGCIHHWQGSPIVDVGGGYCLSPYFDGTHGYAPSSEAIYHTYGKLITQTTAGHTTDCAYLDAGITSNTPIDCGGVTNLGAATARNYWGVGPGQVNNLPTDTPANNMDLFIQNMVIFTCATWQTTQCNN